MSWKFPHYHIGEPPDWSTLEARFDWFRAMKGVSQDPTWHAEGDVFVHTKMVVEALLQLPEFQLLSAEEQHILFAAAMLHDVEKRSTTTTELIDGVERIVSPRHAKKGEYTARALLYRELNAPFAVREQVAKLVRLHGLPLWAIQKPDPEKAVIAASLVVNTQWLALLARADIHGRHCEDKEDILLRIDLFQSLCEDQDCWGKPRSFASGYGRYVYLNRGETAVDYEPFDDLKGTVHVLSALPGSGKDTYIKKHFDLPVLSLDALRRKLQITPTDKKGNGRIIQEGKEQAKAYLRAKTSFVFNATNITSDMRQRWISLFVEYGFRVEIIYLEVPYKQLIQQNHNREYKVPETVLNRMLHKLEIPGPDEAHDLKYVVE